MVRRAPVTPIAPLAVVAVRTILLLAIPASAVVHQPQGRTLSPSGPRYAFMLAAIFVLTYPGSTGSAAEPTVELLWSGIYSVEEERRIEDPGSLAGWHWLTSGAKLELETTHIPARLGIRFGIAFVFRGDKDATIDCQVLWRFPPTTNPDSHTTMTERTVQHSETVDVAVSGHLFVYEWGLVPGTYVVELWLRGTKLISKSYEVFLP